MRTELPTPPRGLGSFRHRDANAQDALNANSPTRLKHSSIPSPHLFPDSAALCHSEQPRKN